MAREVAKGRKLTPEDRRDGKIAKKTSQRKVITAGGAHGEAVLAPREAASRIA